MKSVKGLSKWIAIAAATLVVAAAVAIMVLNAPQCLVLRDAQKGTRFLAIPLEEGGTFCVTFVHSVNKSPVTEIYEVKDGDIYVTTCVYSTLGAGVATSVEEGQSVTRDEQGRWVLSGIDTKIDPLVYIVGTVSDHVLQVRGGDPISLRDLCGRNTKVRFQIRRCLFADGSI